MKRLSLVFLACLLLSAFPLAVFAQEQTPPVTVNPQSAWGEVVDENGNIRYDNLTDLGVIQEDADWMPAIPGFSIGGVTITNESHIPAEYHEYQTPTGNIIVMPTASTMFFMALSPKESGLEQADSQLGLNFGMGSTATGLLKSMSQGHIDPDKLCDMGYVKPDDFFQEVDSGKVNIFSGLGKHTSGFLKSLFNTSRTDQSLYTALLLYTPGDCAHVPGGCPENAKLPAPPAPPPAASCTTPVITSGAITASARLLDPPYPLVVGQDPDKRGVDLAWELRVEPTGYTVGVQVPIYETTCVAWNGQGTSSCTTSDNRAGILQDVLLRYDCQKSTRYYPESLNWVTAIASLSQESRDWILSGELQIRYPGAYLHQPNFSFAGDPAAGSFQGSAFVWDMTRSGVQTADPGWFSLLVNGATSGTPVSSGRPFSLPAGQFQVWLKETAIIQ